MFLFFPLFEKGTEMISKHCVKQNESVSFVFMFFVSFLDQLKK